MTALTWCDKGHEYSAADYYIDWPEGLPKCPVCRKEWARREALDRRAIELLAGLRYAIMDLDNKAERRDFVLYANRVIETLGIPCFYEYEDDGKVYLISEYQGLRIGSERLTDG